MDSASVRYLSFVCNLACAAALFACACRDDDSTSRAPAADSATTHKRSSSAGSSARGVAASDSGVPDGAADAGARSEFSITLSTTACKGRCPIFDLKLNQNGEVEFNGRGNTRQQGWSGKMVPSETTAELLDAIAAANYWELSDRYIERADGCTEVEPEETTYTWSVRTDGPAKIVIDNQGCKGVPEVEALREIPALLIDKLSLELWLGL